MNNGEKYLKTMPYQRNNRQNKRHTGRRNYGYENEGRGGVPSDVVLSPPDTTLMVVVAFLVVIGLMAIFSAGAPKAMDMGQNPASFALKQFAYLIVGFFGLKYFMNLDYKKLRDWAVPFAWFVIVMLALVDFTPLGVIVNGARRWIMLGPIQFQPSEMTKFAVIMLLANAFYRDANIFSSTKWSRYFVPILIMVFLVFKQPNLSMVILLLITSMVMYLSVAGSVKYMVTIGLAGIASAVGTILLFGKNFCTVIKCSVSRYGSIQTWTLTVLDTILSSRFLHLRQAVFGVWVTETQNKNSHGFLRGTQTLFLQ